MKFTTHKLSETQVKDISNWKYSGEYSIYNLPAWEVMVRDKYSLSDELKRDRYIGYTNENKELVGYVSLLDKGNSVSFGIGIKPDYCDKGLGKIITKMTLIESSKRFPNKPVILEVRTWNERAVNCYKSQGFEIVGTKKLETRLGPGEFYIMKYSFKEK